MHLIVKILMRRDNVDEATAIDTVNTAHARIFEDGEQPDMVIHEELGLEPDYFFDLMDPVQPTKTKGQTL